ncbi:MAG: hypothetical protein RBR06_10585 [Desulfuromonadaceae bacterium]|nr:hypothetical protein [Desulfuromonadaceae bacterium]
MQDALLKAIEESDVSVAKTELEKKNALGVDAWDIHLSMFETAQWVMNPPFINPHLPKMYAVCREFEPLLEKEDVLPLVRLEVSEYARRPKLEKFERPGPLLATVSFDDIEAAIRNKDAGGTALLLESFLSVEGAPELSRRLLLLGGGSDELKSSLGHSISCTAFLLLEMMAHPDRDPWPTLAVLANYFCNLKLGPHAGSYAADAPAAEETIQNHMARAVSGTGIVNLHHQITIYALERVRHLFTAQEYNGLVDAWVTFMGDKEEEQPAFRFTKSGPPASYTQFYQLFSKLEIGPVVSALMPMLYSPAARHQMGRFLIKGVSDLYQGKYNPHQLTGLGSTLWVIDRFHEQQSIASGALFQFVDYFFNAVKNT